MLLIEFLLWRAVIRESHDEIQAFTNKTIFKLIEITRKTRPDQTVDDEVGEKEAQRGRGVGKRGEKRRATKRESLLRTMLLL